jgi:hypothetical protein
MTLDQKTLTNLVSECGSPIRKKPKRFTTTGWSTTHFPCTFLNKLISSKSSGVNVFAIFSVSR